MRSGNTEIVESGPSASGPRAQAKASVGWIGLRRARPSFPTPWSNVERYEGWFFSSLSLRAKARAELEADEQWAFCAVSCAAARRRTSLLERENGSKRQFTSRLGHDREMG